MIGTQTRALLVSAYRELSARKLFWLTMILSGGIVLIFAMLGINQNGVTLLWWEFPLGGVNSDLVPPDVFYKLLFSQFGVAFWLAWIATILALVSTASIIPDMVSGGSIDLLLARPIGRARLFLTKYATGLLFTTLQVAVFTIACFFVIGIRGGAWEWWIFISIPLVVLLFSYLFAICALVGLVTRSTIAALLITMLAWGVIFLVNTADGITLAGTTSTEIALEQQEENLAEARAADDPIEVLEPLEEQAAEQRETLETWEFYHGLIFAGKTILPKTGETVGLLERVLRQKAGMDITPSNDSQQNAQMFGNRIDMNEFNERLVAKVDARSTFWIIGTSLLFECALLGFSVWIFCRTDF